MLDSLLRLRTFERDKQVQAAAAAVRHRENLEVRRRELQRHQELAIEAARSSEQADEVNVQSLAAHRGHLTQLLAAIHDLDCELARASDRVDQERGLVLAAEQRLQMLQKLSARRSADREARDRRRAQQELEEVWSAGQFTARD